MKKQLKAFLRRSPRLYRNVESWKNNLEALSKELVRKLRIFTDSSYAPILEMSSAMLQIQYYRNFLQSKDQLISVLCDSVEARYIIDQGIKWGVLPPDTPVILNAIDPPTGSTNHIGYASKWPEQIKGVVVPRLFFNDDGCLHQLYLHLQKRGKIAIFDQVATHGNTWSFDTPKRYEFRELTYILKKETVIPSYYANDLYIDYLLDLCKARKFKKAMDICSGSGCIGLSLLKESDYVDSVSCVEINPRQVQSIKSTIFANGLSSEAASVYCSDGLTNVPGDLKFDLIVGNPPHQNRPTSGMFEIQGGDENWDFHQRFLECADRFLVDEGVICLIENGRPNYSNAELFKKMIEQCAPNLVLYDSRWLPGTEWYLLLICKRDQVHLTEWGVRDRLQS